MNSWITDRKPTAEDADRKGYVWCADTESELCVTRWDSFSFDTSLAWQPRTLPLPYVPPKPKRGVLWRAPKEWQVSSTKVSPAQVAYIEKLPGDPDFDELLEAIDAYDNGVFLWSELREVRNRNVK